MVLGSASPPPSEHKSEDADDQKVKGSGGGEGEGVEGGGESSRWNKGRGWDGLGQWCDEETSGEWSRDLERLSQENPDMTVTQMLELVVERFGDKRAVTYLDVKGQEIVNHSFGEMLTYIQRIAAYMQREMGLRPGDSAVLLYPPGPEFILAFLACIYGGIVAVPVYPPHPYRFETDVPRLKRIVANSGCKVAMTDSQYILVIRGIALKNMLSRIGLTKSVTWPSIPNIQTDKIRTSYCQHTTLLASPRCVGDDVAFLQYTSGSTSDPKGVMVTHGNLHAQIRLLALHASGADSQARTNNHTVVSWLPQYHDMGLIGIFLVCIATGVHIVYLSPTTFLQDPTQWLLALHKYQAKDTCAPNFAFALAQRRTSEELRDKLDLSHVEVVVCGAEPIRQEVMESFFDYFKPCGFHPTALVPSYGLAEFTLCATSQPLGRPLNVLHVDQQDLSATGEVMPVPEGTPGAACYIGVGSTLNDGSVCRIVDPATCECVGEDVVGEIWLDGPSKTKGYFNDPEKTAAAFHGVIKGEEEGGRLYLQTGDQGFIHGGQLFITGRIKDLIIVRGRNIYPQDVEYAVEQVMDKALRPGCSAAFARVVEGGGGQEGETVAYVAELREIIKDKGVLKDIADSIRRAVAEDFQVAVTLVVLVEPRSIPKTTSGKIQRYKCRNGCRDGALKEVYRWEADASTAVWLAEQTMDGASVESYYSARPGEGWCSEMVLPEAIDTDNGDEGAASTAAAIATTAAAADIEDQEERGGEEQASQGEAGDPPSPQQQSSPREGYPSPSGHDHDDDGTAAVIALEEVEKRQQEYIQRLVDYVVQVRSLPVEAVDIDQPMTLFGFDSLAFVVLGRTMGDWMGKEISPSIVYKYTTIREVAGFLARGAREEELLLDGASADEEGALMPDLQAPIAIVGIGCMAPGGPEEGNLVGKEAFWRFVMEGKTALREDMPAERKVDRSTKVPGNYLDGVDRFDAGFFGLTRQEVEHLDYHQSMVLETAWHALEDAGSDPTSLEGKKVGVYIGALSHEYAVLEALRGESSVFAPTGTGNSLLAGRVAHVLNTKGPAMVFDTACSSSLVAIHNAVRDLRLGPCSMALAGGVNLLLTSESSAALLRAGLLAPECRPFDAGSLGFCRGEGCGMVVMKRLSRALLDGDRVYALIRGSAVNHDGRTHNLSTPNPLAQEEVIKAAWRDAGVTANQVRYIEAHGAGTRLGDTMEMAALGGALAGRDPSLPPCLVATSKPNIGYMEAACGAFSVIRAALILYHGVVPRLVNFEVPNPYIPWNRLPVRIPLTNTRLEEDPITGTTIAGTTAVGFSGTNGHVVLESMPKTFDSHEYDVSDSQEEGGRSEHRLPLFLPISARSEGALRRLASSYAELLGKTHGYDRTVELCLEASIRRAHYKGHRLAAIGRSPEELRKSIMSQLGGSGDDGVAPVVKGERRSFQPLSRDAEPEVVFLFTGGGYVGHGAGGTGMGRGLYERNVLFRVCIDECDALMAPRLGGASIVQGVILASPSSGSPPQSLLRRPALFAIHYGLVRVWALLGVEPKVVMGDSVVGEVAAATVAGCIKLEEAIDLICSIAQALDTLPPSAGQGESGVTAVNESEGVVTRLMATAAGLEITAVYGRACVHVAGPLVELQRLEKALTARSISFRRLTSSGHPVLLHSAGVDKALPAIASAAARVAGHAPRSARLISLLTGGQVRMAPSPEHWQELVRRPALFFACLQAALSRDGSSTRPQPRIVVVLGPGGKDNDSVAAAVETGCAVLEVAVIKCMGEGGGGGYNDDNLELMRATAAAYVAGVTLSFQALKKPGAAASCSSITLPLYPFEPTVTMPLGELTTTALARVDMSDRPTAQRGGGPRMTYLLEEGWLPRADRRGGRGGGGMMMAAAAGGGLPAHVVYVCSDVVDAVVLASVKALAKRSYAIIVPSQEGSKPFAQSACITAIDFLGQEESLKAALRGPPGAESVAVVYVAACVSEGRAAIDHRLCDEAFGETARLLTVLRCLTELRLGERHRLWVTTTQAKLAAPGDRVKSMGAALWAATKSAMLECYPSLWAALIDLPGWLGSSASSSGSTTLSSGGAGDGITTASSSPSSAATATRFVAIMDREMMSYGPNDPPQQLALRQGVTWLVLRLRKAPMESQLDNKALLACEGLPNASIPLPGIEVPIRQTYGKRRGGGGGGGGGGGDDGWYLVTGGLSARGVQAAAALYRHGARRLLLVHADGAQASDSTTKAAEVEELREARAGGEVRMERCDVGDRAAVMALFARMAAVGGIRGVVHCEGAGSKTPEGGLKAQNVDGLEAAWRLRVEGALHLHEACARQQQQAGSPAVDLFVVYSSSAALMGAAERAATAAADGALDSLALLRRQQGLPGTSLQWGSWRGEAGADRMALLGFGPVSRSLSALVLTTLLNHDHDGREVVAPAGATPAPAVVCCQPIDWPQMVANGPGYLLQVDLASFEPVKRRVAPRIEAPKFTEEMRKYAALKTSKERRAMIEDTLVAAVRECTGKELSRSENLMDSGVTIGEGVQLAEMLRKRYPIKFELARLLELPTIEKLSPTLVSEIDRIVDGSLSLPLSKAQQLAFMSTGSRRGGGRGDFFFAEVHLGSPAEARRVLTAWSTLLRRHPMLRTTLELSVESGSGSQRVLEASGVSVADMVGTLPDNGPARDLSSLEVAVAEAAKRQDTIPPARLFLAMGASSTVVLAVSRLLTDRGSLQVLAGELMALCSTGRGMALAAPRSSFIEKLRVAAKQHFERCETYGGGNTTSQSGGSSSLSSSLQTTSPQLWAPQVAPIVCVPYDLPSQLAIGLERYGIKQRVAPETVLLSAYLLALHERSHPQMESDVLPVLVDLHAGRSDLLGPVSVPFVLTVDIDTMFAAPAAYRVMTGHASSMVVDVDGRLEQALEGLQESGWLGPTMTGMDVISDSLPAFRFYKKVPNIDIGVVGDRHHGQQAAAAMVPQVLELAVTRFPGQQDHNSRSSKYLLQLRSADPNAGLDGLMVAIIDHLGALIDPHGRSTAASVLGRKYERGQNPPDKEPGKVGCMAGAEKGSRGDAHVMVVGDCGPEDMVGANTTTTTARFQPLPCWLAGLVQVVGIAAIGTVAMLPALLVWPVLQLALHRLGITWALVLCPIAYHCLGLIMVSEILLIRAILLRSSTGDFPINSWPFLRWWFMTRLIEFTDPIYMKHMQGTALYTWWLRALGARIGDNVRVLPGAKMSDPEMVVVGDDAVIGKANLMGSVVRGGVLRRGIVEVGERSHVGTHVVMLPNSKLGRYAVLKPVSVVGTGQVLPPNSVYEGAPACFIEPRDDIDVEAGRAGASVAPFVFFLHQALIMLLPLYLSTLSAALSYPAVARMAKAAGLFPELDWAAWKEGRILLALSMTTGLVPLLALPTLIVHMSFRANAMMLSDSVLVDMARAAGFKLAASALRNLFKTEQGVEILRAHLPEGVQVMGSAGNGLYFICSGEQVLRHVALGGVALPTATVYYVVGVFWVLAVGFVLQGFILTALTNLAYYPLLALTSSQDPHRVHGFRSYLRQLRISLVRFTYNCFMRLFLGSELLTFWYWTLGAKVGEGVTLADAGVIQDPHLVTLDNGATLVDDAVLETMSEWGHGYCAAGKVMVGVDAVVGVRSVLAPGTKLGNGAIVMPQTAVKPSSTPVLEPGTVLMGVPATRLVNLPTLMAGESAFGRAEWGRHVDGGGGGGGGIVCHVMVKLLRGWIVPLASCTLNVLCLMIASYPPSLFLFYLMAAKDRHGGGGGGLGWDYRVAQVMLPIVYLGFGACLLLFVVLQKWLFVCRTKAGTQLTLGGARYHARTHYLIMASAAAQAALDNLRGTVWCPLYLRLLGAKVHPTAYIDTLNVTDPDLVTIGERAVVDCDAALLPNDLKAGKLRLGPIRVDDGARVGVTATVLRGCRIGCWGELADAVSLPPGQSIRAGGVWQGAAILLTANAGLVNSGNAEEDMMVHESLVNVAIRV